MGLKVLGIGMENRKAEKGLANNKPEQNHLLTMPSPPEQNPIETSDGAL